MQQVISPEIASLENLTALADSQLERLLSDMNAFHRKSAQTVWEIGKTFTEAKKLVPHGGWGKWLNDRGAPHRTAQHWMRLYSEYPQKRKVCAFGTVDQAMRALTADNFSPEPEQAQKGVGQPPPPLPPPGTTTVTRKPMTNAGQNGTTAGHSEQEQKTKQAAPKRSKADSRKEVARLQIELTRIQQDRNRALEVIADLRMNGHTTPQDGVRDEILEYLAHHPGSCPHEIAKGVLGKPLREMVSEGGITVTQQNGRSLYRIAGSNTTITDV